MKQLKASSQNQAAAQQRPSHYKGSSSQSARNSLLRTDTLNNDSKITGAETRTRSAQPLQTQNHASFYKVLKAINDSTVVQTIAEMDYATQAGIIDAETLSSRNIDDLNFWQKVGYYSGEAIGAVAGVMTLAATAVVTRGLSKSISKFWNSSQNSSKETSPDFASRKLAENHFAKHGSEFKSEYSNTNEYVAGARDVIKNGTKVAYEYKNETRIGYVRFMGNTTKNGAAKFENLLAPIMKGI